MVLISQVIKAGKSNNWAMEALQFHIIQAATKLFRSKGFEKVTMATIAAEAGLTEAELFTHFGHKEDIILALYQSINSDWKLLVNDLPEKKLANRFEKALLDKLDLMEPYANLLADMMGLLIRNPKIGVQATRTSHIRHLGLQTMEKLVFGASDGQVLQQKIKQLPSFLYLLHWGILFLYLQNPDKTTVKEAVKLAAKMINQASNFSLLLGFSSLFKEAGLLAEKMVAANEISSQPLDREILKIVFNHRKTTEATEACLQNTCETCFALHEPGIRFFTSRNKPLQFILPAFPAKSPNAEKVLGNLPDLGEQIALQTLEGLCQEIKSIYPPGANLVICSDGRIFSELVGVTDAEVTAYVAGIKSMISQLGLKHVSIVNLEDLLTGNSFDHLRNQVLGKFSEPLEELSKKVKTNADFKSLFNGIHRFISEDRKEQFPEKSGTKVKEEAKLIALQVIQHSNAWTRFLTYVYPDAIRLSIHPYPAHHDKIGIRLTKATDNWLTPWHGVVVLQPDGYMLMKKSQAETSNARLIYQNGQPFYYTLIPE